MSGIEIFFVIAAFVLITWAIKIKLRETKNDNDEDDWWL